MGKYYRGRISIQLRNHPRFPTVITLSSLNCSELGISHAGYAEQIAETLVVLQTLLNSLL